MSLPEDCEVCQNCGCEPCKCSSEGPKVYAPSNSDDILDPVASDELADSQEDEDAEEEEGGSSETETETEDMSCYGPLAADFTAPAIGANGTITITGAANFAAAGGYIWIPGLGYLLVNSAGSDTLAVTNQDITAGTVINTGTKAYFFPPMPAAVFSGMCIAEECGCEDDPEPLDCIDSIFACKGGKAQGVLFSNLRSLILGAGGAYAVINEEVFQLDTNVGAGSSHVVPLTMPASVIAAVEGAATPLVEISLSILGSGGESYAARIDGVYAGVCGAGGGGTQTFSMNPTVIVPYALNMSLNITGHAFASIDGDVEDSAAANWVDIRHISALVKGVFI